MFDTTLPSGKRMRYQVLRIAVPRKGRALPLVQLAYTTATPSRRTRARTSSSRTRFGPWFRRFLWVFVRSS